MKINSKILRKLAEEAPRLAIIKAYVHLITAEHAIGCVVPYTVAYIAEETGMSYKTAHEAVKWLLNKNYLKKGKLGGTGVFIIINKIGELGGKVNAPMDEQTPDIPEIIDLDAEEYEEEDDFAEADGSEIPAGAKIYTIDMAGGEKDEKSTGSPTKTLRTATRRKTWNGLQSK